MIRKLRLKPSRVNVHIGKRLRVRRALLGISQQRLAFACGVSLKGIQKYEGGAKPISAELLYEFSRLLEVPMEYFFIEYGAGRSGEK